MATGVQRQCTRSALEVHRPPLQPIHRSLPQTLRHHHPVVGHGQVEDGRRIVEDALRDPNQSQESGRIRYVLEGCDDVHAHCLAGYPASDGSVYEYWSERVERVGNQDLAFFRVHAFLKALFDKTKEVVEDLYREGADESTIAARFREYMTDGQTMASQDVKRVQFYKHVVSFAERVSGSIRSIFHSSSVGFTGIQLEQYAMWDNTSDAKNNDPAYRQLRLAMPKGMCRSNGSEEIGPRLPT